MPGPVSKPRTSGEPAASSVALAMPPMFTTARWRVASRNRAAWNSGANGAPSPPAAMSRRRKSATVSMPVISATRFASPICTVKGGDAEGWWRMVWPWQPMARTSLLRDAPVAQTRDDARADEVAEPGVRGADLRHLVHAGRTEFPKVIRQRVRKGDGGGCDDGDRSAALPGFPAGHVDERDIQPVDAGARHHANVAHGRDPAARIRMRDRSGRQSSAWAIGRVAFCRSSSASCNAAASLNVSRSDSGMGSPLVKSMVRGSLWTPFTRNS